MLKIIDENGKSLGPYEQGEIVVQGETVFCGTKMLLMKIWLHLLTGGSEWEIWDISMRRGISISPVEKRADQ